MAEARTPPHADFATPGADFRIATFWFWHRIPAGAEIEAQLADMKARGISRIMIQARPALPMNEYLSPAYLKAYAHSARLARKLGLRMTIYDEYGWMSGHGGGRTVRGADHLRERHLFWTSGPAGQNTTELTISDIRSDFLDFLGERGRHWLYEGGAPLWGDWQPVMVAGEGQSRPLNIPLGFRASGPASVTITLSHGGLVAPGQRLTVFAAARCLTSRMVNYLLPETAERFADTVYAPLAEAAGEAADGFFFDHPYAGFYRWKEHHGPLGNSLLWDESLLEGGSAADAKSLVALVTGEDDESRTARARFIRAYAARMHEAYFGTLSRWAAKRGLGFTGHELLTHVGAWGLCDGLTGFDPRVMPGVDYFGIDGYRSVTAVDSADFAPQLSARMGDSVARAHGRRRCMIEQYATGRETGAPGLAGQWGLSVGKFRAQALCNVMFGARQIVLHAVNVSDGEAGDGLFSARFDFAPAYNFLPWWEDAGAIFMEIARLSAFVEEGDNTQAIALFYPHATLLAEGPHTPAGQHFGRWAEALARSGLGHVIVDERQLTRLAAGAAPGRTLILPAAGFLHHPQSFQALRDFTATGGRLIVSGDLPRRALDRCAGTVTGLADILARKATPLTHVPDATPQAIAAMVATLPRPACDARLPDGTGWVSVLAMPDGRWRIAALNGSDAPAPLTIVLPAEGFGISRWDCGSGAVHVLRPARAGRDTDLMLGPQELCCLVIGPADRLPEARKAPAAPTPVVLADGWTLTLPDAPARPIEVTRGWEAQGHPGFCGTGLYAREIELPPPGDGLLWHLVLPGLAEVAAVHINGRHVGTAYAGRPAVALRDANGHFRLELSVRNAAANRYYAGTPYWDGVPQPSGLTCPPRLVALPDADA